MKLSSISSQTFSLSKYFADIVCGPDKQDVAFLLVGAKGMGKSYSALSYCVLTAMEIAKQNGGVWQDYFPFDPAENTLPNVSTISTQDHLLLLKNIKRHNVYLLDDIGVGWNARTYQKDSNILMNDIFELIRIDNVVMIMTVMDQFLIDKVPRSIVPFFGEVVQKNHYAGYNVLKIFQNRKMFRAGKMLYPYITDKDARKVRYVVEKPPPDVAHAYDLLRMRKTKEHRDNKIGQFFGGAPAKEKKRKGWQEYLTEYGDQVKALCDQGMSIRQVSKKIGLHADTVGRIAVNMGCTL